ncbi:MAG: dipeptide epimerase, partial [Armatimonadetes bacterium]|nr:dipeptide epimerase [Armatimonadota bacterium]
EAAVERYLADAVGGRDPADVAGLHAVMDGVLFGNPSAKAAVDVAIHDLLGKHLGVPVWVLLGGCFRDRVAVTRAVGMGSDSQVVAAACTAAARGFRVVKLKAGTRPEDDVRRVRAVREAIGPGPQIRVDANGGYCTAREAIAALRAMEGLGVDLAEQPVSRFDLEGLAAIRRATAIPVLVDESVHSPEDALRVIRAQAADVISVKVQKAGGLYPAMRVVAVADAAHVPVTVGSWSESGLGSAANLHLIAAIRHLAYPCDLKGPDTFTVDIVREPVPIVDGEACVPDGPGLGVTLDDDRLARVAV